MRDVDDLLTGLRDLPAPVPPAAAARGRGDARTRRTRALLGAGAVAAVAVTAFAAVALTAGPPQRLTPAPPAPPTPSPSATATRAAEPPLSALLLRPRDVGAALGGTWTVGSAAVEPLPFGCLGDVPSVPVATAYAAHQDGRRAAHQVARYPSAAAARAAYRAFVDGVRRCDGWALDRVEGDVAYVRRGSATHAVRVVGTVVSGVSVNGDARRLPELADRAAARVRCPDCPPAAPPWSAEDALLDVADARQVEPGAWQRETSPGGRVLDPCPGRTPRREDAAVRDSAEGGLVLRREAGGTGVDQEVYRYPSARLAAAALDGYERAVRRCPREPGSVRGTTTLYDVARREADALYVRVGCAGECVPWPVYVAVVRVGDGLAVVEAGWGEDGDPGLAFAQRWGRAAAAELRAVRR